MLSTPEGFVHDMRAQGELQTDGEGRALVPVVTERQHFEAQLLGQSSEPVLWPVHLVWID